MMQTYRIVSRLMLSSVGRQCTCSRLSRVISTTQNTEDPSLLQEFKKASGHSVDGNPNCRTNLTNPMHHSLKQEGLFYSVPTEDYKRWLIYGIPKEFNKLMDSFNEYCFMVRRPALEIMHYLKMANYSMPAIRYIIYGIRGCGKTWTLAHVRHFCGSQGWFIVHVPFGARWATADLLEQQPSTYKPERIDSPLNSVTWLNMFSKMNESLIKEHDIRVEHNYTWNKRESSVPGDSILDIVQMGVERPKYATDCVGAILKEVRHLANTGKHKVLVSVDGVNGFWADSRIKVEGKKVPTENLSLIHQFKKMISNDWCGGAVVCSVDASASSRGERESFMPRYLLGKQGFDLMDPFLPIHVDNYSDKEMHSCLDYLTDRLWIQNPKGRTEEGRKELIFLCQNNPLETLNVTQDW